MSYPPTAIVQDRETAKWCVLKLDGVLGSVPSYRMVAGRYFENRQDAIRSATDLAGEVPIIQTVETPCGDKVCQ